MVGVSVYYKNFQIFFFKSIKVFMSFFSANWKLSRKECHRWVSWLCRFSRASINLFFTHKIPNFLQVANKKCKLLKVIWIFWVFFNISLKQYQVGREYNVFSKQVIWFSVSSSLYVNIYELFFFIVVLYFFFSGEIMKIYVNYQNKTGQAESWK